MQSKGVLSYLPKIPAFIARYLLPEYKGEMYITVSSGQPQCEPHYLVNNLFMNMSPAVVNYLHKDTPFKLQDKDGNDKKNCKVYRYHFNF